MINEVLTITPPASYTNEPNNRFAIIATIIFAILCIASIILSVVLRKKHHPVLSIVFILISITCGGFCIKFATDISTSSTKSTQDNYKATDSSVLIKLNDEFSFENEYEMIPKYNIKNLEITFTYYDSKQRILATKTKVIGNVEYGKTYLITISLSEFTLSQLLRIDSCTAHVTNGEIYK